MTERINLTMKK